MDETKVGSEMDQNRPNLVRGLQACRRGMRPPLDLTVGMGKTEKLLPGLKVGLEFCKNYQYTEQSTENFVLRQMVPHSNRRNLHQKRKTLIQELNNTRK
jgi:hypothetical protein